MSSQTIRSACRMSDARFFPPGHDKNHQRMSPGTEFHLSDVSRVLTMIPSQPPRSCPSLAEGEGSAPGLVRGVNSIGAYWAHCQS